MFVPLSILFSASTLLFSVPTVAFPQRGRGGGQTAQQQAAQIPQGVSQATDGSTILDTTAMI
ncbi:hypothetical protein LTS18_001405, partial [Coniosporium uncinatum]